MKKLTKQEKILLPIYAIIAVILIWVAIMSGIQEKKYENLEELRPCPFCGGTNVVYSESEHDIMKEGVPDVERVTCKDCHLDMWAHRWCEDIGAKEKWNNRKMR